MSNDQEKNSKPCGEWDGVELTGSDIIRVLKVMWFPFRCFLKEKPGQILLSAIVLLMLWGYHGELTLLQLVWSDYKGPGIDIGNRPQIIPGIPWDNELISFFGGALLVVIIPMLIIKFVFKEPWSNYGLGLPAKGRRSLAFVSFIILMVIGCSGILAATKDPGMQALYPFYRPFSGLPQFLLYEVCYLPFFIAIEFIFRGYLLFGLAGIKGQQLSGGNQNMFSAFFFGRYALLIQMLSYTAWHLGKPLPETFSTLVWGLAAGAVAYSIKSLWPVILAHWLFNILLDAVNCGMIHLSSR